MPFTFLATTLSSTNIEQPKGFADNLGNLINGVLSFVMVIAALLVLYNLIVAGIEWITSGGDKGKVEQARNKMVAAVVGIIIVSASFAIMMLVVNFLGFKNLNDVFSSVQMLSGGSFSPISISFQSNEFTNVCGGGLIDNKYTICNKGCDLELGKCVSDQPYVFKFTCDGLTNECNTNRSAPDYQQTVFDAECGKTYQIDIFDKDCLSGPNDWNCSGDNVLDYFVWYSGDCT